MIEINLESESQATKNLRTTIEKQKKRLEEQIKRERKILKAKRDAQHIIIGEAVNNA